MATNRRETLVGVMAAVAEGDPASLHEAWASLRSGQSAIRLLPNQTVAITRVSGLEDLRRRAHEFRSMLLEAGAPPIFWLGVGGPSMLASSEVTARTEAARAIELARMLYSEPRMAIYVDMLLMDALASSPGIQRRLSDLIAPLKAAARRSPELITTLHAYFQNDLSKASTANALGVHRHTIDYRLGRVQSILGLSPRVGVQRALLEIAFAANLLSPDEVEMTSVGDALKAHR
jgi:DNA-binding PucR family transcriptional regulator